MKIYLPHDTVKERLGVVLVADVVDFGLGPLHLEGMMGRLEGLFGHHANPVARVPPLDLGDDMVHDDMGLHRHRDLVGPVKLHVGLGKGSDGRLVVAADSDSCLANHNTDAGYDPTRGGNGGEPH